MELKRSVYCAQATAIGESVTVSGWVARRRDLGNLLFIDLRDRSGIIQLAFDEHTIKEVFERAQKLRSEYVISARGVVRRRESVNKELPTGEVEVFVDALEIHSKAQTPPFEIVDDTAVKEELRLKYRYLDLRRPEQQQKIIFRHKLAKATRDFFDAEGFLEIETPMMIKSTPEGARDYVIPSRVHPGNFYALPQSPQMYKQLLMVAGFDKYFQLARCFRDEDLRADRQPEFTQIDLEMSFVEMEDVMAVGERYMRYLFSEVLGEALAGPVTRLTYRQAMEEYGSDKPDLRFEMTIRDLSDVAKDCGFSVFSSAVAAGGTVRGICAKGGCQTYTRKEIDKLTEYARGIGAKGLAWIRYTAEGAVSSFGKFMDSQQMERIAEILGAQEGDVVFIVADAGAKLALSVLGALRCEVAKRLDIIRSEFALLWVTEFPFFEWDEQTQSYQAMHHPFTAPLDECVQYLETAPDQVRAKAYDLVLNGVELCSGSIRITDPVLQGKMFAALGLSEEEAQTKFGFLTDAFSYGAPPHGGMGIGFDRLAMILCGCDNLRQVVAFPKVQNASELMTACPAPIAGEQLDELGIRLDERKDGACNDG